MESTSSHPLDLSFSRVQTYERCPWMYRLVFQEGWRSGPNAKMAMGQSLHQTMAAFYSQKNTDKTLDQLMELFDQYWVNEGFSSSQETLEAYQRGRTMLERVYNAEKGRLHHIAETNVEMEFKISLANGVQFRGTMDRLDKHNDGAMEIVEYKSDAEAWPEKRCASDPQMTFYALGMRTIAPHVPLRFRYVFFSNGQSVTTARTPEQCQEAQRRLDHVAERLQAKDWSPNYNSCPSCPFVRRCAKAKGKESQ